MHHTVSRTTGGKNRLISSDRNYFFFCWILLCFKWLLIHEMKWPKKRGERAGSKLFFSNFFWKNQTNEWVKSCFVKTGSFEERERDRERAKATASAGMHARWQQLLTHWRLQYNILGNSGRNPLPFYHLQEGSASQDASSEDIGTIRRIVQSFFFLCLTSSFTQKKRGGSSAYANERTIFLFFCQFASF